MIHAVVQRRNRQDLKRNANAHLKFVRHHALAQRVAREILLRKSRPRTKSPIPLRHISPTEASTDIGNRGYTNFDAAYDAT